MSTTPNMSLVVPEVLVTTGPQYAQQINDALDVIDAHDHSSGKGVRVTPSGLNINIDLPFGNNQATNVKAVQLSQQTSVLTNAAIYNKGGDLYYRRGDGTEVRITTAAGVNVSGVGGITGLTNPAAATYTPAAVSFSWLSDAATFAKTGTGDLSIYSRAGAVGVVQAVTLVADVTTSAYSLRLPAAGPADNQLMRMKAATAGAFVDLLGTNNQVTVTHNTSDITLSLPQNIHTGASPTFNTLNLTDGINMAGAIAGATTGAFSGQVNVGSLVSTGAVSGGTGTFSGNISLTGAAGSTISGANYAATFGSVITDGLSTNLIAPKSGTYTAFSGQIYAANGMKADTIVPYSAAQTTTGNLSVNGNLKATTINEYTTNVGVQMQGRKNGAVPTAGYIGQVVTYTAGSDQAISTIPGEYNVVSFLVDPGEWEVSGNSIIHIDPNNTASGNNTVQIYLLQTAISASSAAFDDPSYISSVGLTNTPTITGALGKVYSAAFKRRIRVSVSTAYYLVTSVVKPIGSTAGTKFLASSFVKLERVA